MTKPTNQATASPPVAIQHWIDRWLTAKLSTIGSHSMTSLSEQDGTRAAILAELLATTESHYVAPSIKSKRLIDLGAAKTAVVLQEHLPKTKRARSGELGEILATEITEHKLLYQVPVRRLRWKDGREMALRGDDIVGVRIDSNGRLQILKGESKSRAVLSASVLLEAAKALDRDQGRPTRHAVLFVADRLREQGDDKLATALENAVLNSYKGMTTEQLLFVLSGNGPDTLLSEHLQKCNSKVRRFAVGIRIRDHQDFIKTIIEGL